MKHLALLALLLGGSPALAQDAGSTGPTAAQLARGQAVLNGFFAALKLADEGASARAVVPFLHKSLLDASGQALSADTLRFGFKKARRGADSYAMPLQVAQTKSAGRSGVGFRTEAEQGLMVDYYLERGKKQPGLAAPVKLFFPEGGGEPKVLFMGNL